MLRRKTRALVGWEMLEGVEVSGMVGRGGFTENWGSSEERERAAWVSWNGALRRGNSRGVFRQYKEAMGLERRVSVRPCWILDSLGTLCAAERWSDTAFLTAPPGCSIENRTKGAAVDAEPPAMGCCSKWDGGRSGEWAAQAVKAV